MNNWWLKIIFVFGLVYALLRFGPSLPITSVVTQKTDLFSVSGEGKVNVIPDVAILNLGMSAHKPTVKAAQTEVNSAINALTQALKSFAVDNKDIKTTNFSVYPDYNDNRVSGFNANINLTVTVREIDKVNDILDKATALGINSVGGVQFTVDEDKLKNLTQEARKKAIDDAKEKATGLSSAAGMTLGKIVNIQEGGTAPRPMYYATKDAVGMGGGGAEVQPGSTDITSSVTLFYETR
jgi:uncharacterized protein YggE